MRKLQGFVLVILLALFLPALADDSSRAVVYSPHAARQSCHMNMGPVGARAWMRGSHFVVMSIDRNSPAHGRLQPADLVIAVNGTHLNAELDSRIILGNAIGDAEASGNPLALTVLRGGDEQVVAVPLPALGAFSKTWPADCEKSERILDAACRSLLNAQMPNGVMTLVSSNSMGTYLSGLLMLASADPKYLDGARRAAYATAAIDYTVMDTNNWPMSYGAVLLAEYYLATGDDTVLEKLGWLVEKIAAGQMKCGTWGHNSPAAGYGALNQPGVVCAIALVLATECGIDVDRVVLNKALAFFGKFAELGSIPYGDNLPGRSLDNHGTSSSAAVLMHLAGRQGISETFSRAAAMSYWMREDGHTGPFFSFVWGPLAASLAGGDAFQNFMDYQRWYYNLCRTWKGELVLLPYHEALTRFDDNGYIYSGGNFSTGGMALAFALPKQHLRILGAPASVFSTQTELAGDLLAARSHYLAREWAACDKRLAGIDPATLKNEDERYWLAQLKKARNLSRASMEITLLEIESNLTEGAPYRASEQLVAMQRALGENGDPRLQILSERLAQGSFPWHIREGKMFYQAWNDWNLCAIKSWVPQGKLAKYRLEGVPSLRQPIWEPLSPASELSPQTWKSLLLPGAAELPAAWQTMEFDDRSWIQHEGIFTAIDAKDGKDHPRGPIAARRRFTVENTEGAKLRVRLRTVRPARTKVYLNGVLIVDAVRGQRGGYAAIELDPLVFDLLKRGENILAVTSDRQGSGANHLDVALEINRIDIEQRMLPPIHAERLPAGMRPEGDETLRVQESKIRYQRALQERYNGKPMDALIADLEESVPYVRQLAENGLLGKGLEGIRNVVARIDHENWKVRSSVCSLIEKAYRAHNANPDSEEMALLRDQIPALARLLQDEHFWVRTRAASALQHFGDDAVGVVPQLLERVQDHEEWVRIAALSAIRRLSKDPAVNIRAAEQALMNPGSSFGASGIAVHFFKAHPQADATRLESLRHLLRHPPEGGGGSLLSEAIDMAAALDPEGNVVIAVLIEAAADKTHFSRQRGNPRGKAIEVLGNYGPKAAAAVPVLKAILTEEDARGKAMHEVARKALAEITGERDEE